MSHEVKLLPCDVERVAYKQMESLKNLLGPPSDADIRWAAQRIARDMSAAIEAMSRPTVVTGEHQNTGDHALPPSGLSQSPLSQPKAAAAIARGEK